MVLQCLLEDRSLPSVFVCVSGPQLGRGVGAHQQRVSHQTVSVVCLANDSCLQDYDLVEVHC